MGLDGESERLFSSWKLWNELRPLRMPVESVVVDESWLVVSVRVVGESADLYEE
jgi:hypothetical protein